MSLGSNGADRAEVPDLSVSGDNFDLVEDDPHDPTTTSEPEAPMQSLNQLPVVTDLVDCKISLITKIVSCPQSKNGQEKDASNLIISRGGVLNTRGQR